MSALNILLGRLATRGIVGHAAVRRVVDILRVRHPHGAITPVMTHLACHDVQRERIRVYERLAKAIVGRPATRAAGGRRR